MSANDSTLAIGQNGDGGAYYQGYISEYRFTKGEPVYTSSFELHTAPYDRPLPDPLPATNPEFANVAFLTGFEGAEGSVDPLLDDTGVHTILMRSDAVLKSDQRRFGNTSLYLAGTNDYSEIGHAPELSVAVNEEFTAEAWVRPTAACLQKSISLVLNKRGSSGASEYWLLLREGVPSLVIFKNGDPIVNVIAADQIPADEWSHLAFVRKANEYSLYVNGFRAARVVAANSPQGNSSPVLIGKDAYSSGREFIGWIDEVRITNEAFYVSTGFIPPTSAFPRS